MITNERQYRIMRNRAERAREALNSSSEIDLIKQGIDPIVASAHRASLTEQLEKLERDLTRYQELSSGAVKEFSATSILELGERFIEARIARGLSQNDLAKRLGMKEQQVQRYEQERYVTANLARLNEVAATLQLELDACFSIGTQDEFDARASCPNTSTELDLSKFPIKEMKRRGWLRDVLPSDGRSTNSDFELAAAFISQVRTGPQIHALHRQHIRAGGRFDEYALMAWKAQVLHRAKRLLSRSEASALLDAVFIKHLVELSKDPNGPIRAVEMLRERGVIVVFEMHLPETHLDGAAMLLNNTTPVIGLTLRQDRLDNFWFVLLHEIAHVVRHREQGLRDGFFDDDTAHSTNRVEKEADEFAQNALIPDVVWKSSFVRFTKSRDQVLEFAKKQNISPSIVAGRIRRERGDFSLFGDIVGQGEPKKIISAAGLLET